MSAALKRFVAQHGYVSPDIWVCTQRVVHVCLAEYLLFFAAGLVRNYLYDNANVTVAVYGVNVSTIVDVSAFATCSKIYLPHRRCCGVCL